MKSKEAELYRLFSLSVENEFIVNPIDWIRENVRSAESARSAQIDLRLSPFLLPVVNDFLNNPNVKHINVLAPTGAGKSTTFVALLNYIICNDAGATLLALQDDDEAKNFAETRLYPTFAENPKMQDLMPRQRSKSRKSEIIFPHMPLFVVGANYGSLQSKSCRYLIGDEIHAWKRGMIKEFLARHHDRWNRKILMVSQGANRGTDWEKKYNEGRIKHYHWICPKCGATNAYDFRDIKYNWEEGMPWEEVFDSVRMACPACSHEIEDTISNRRSLSDKGVYIDSGNNGLPDMVSYNFNVLACYWIKWSTIVQEWIEANKEKNKGDTHPLRLFLQKRLAQNTGLLSSGEKEIKITLSNYSKSDYENGALIEDERTRIMTVDVQKGYFYATIYAWDNSLNAYLIYEDRVEKWEDLEGLQAWYGVKDSCVGVDSGYETTDVRKECGRRKWFSVNGTVKESYLHMVKKKPVHRLIAKPETYLFEKEESEKIKCFHFNFSSQGCKDVFANRQIGGLVHFPRDVSKMFIKHMTAESKHEEIDKRTGSIVQRWKADGENHLFDCSVQQIAMAMIVGLL